MKLQPLAPDDPNHIGRYRLLGELGSGGMGRVLLGVGPDGRFVAIKQVHAHLLDESDYRARFGREVAATARVSGAFTAPVIDFDIDCHTPWLASVFVVGLPLDRAVAEYGPLPVPSVHMLALGMASALQAIHQTGLIHRDLKPANVILAADGPRVIDFGIAQVTETTSQLTEAGSVLGSPAFMSPEQALSEPLTPASDVFSLGSLLAMAATGVSLFQASTLAYTLFNIVHTAPNLERVPLELRALITGCLHKDPQARPTPTQILDYLGQSWSQERPWPPPIHSDIDRQSGQLAVLTADPDATQVISGRRRNGGNRTAVRAKSRRRSTVLLAALTGLVVAVVAGATVVWAGRGGDAATPDVLTQLREADACRWIEQAVGPNVPAEVASGWPVDVTDWSWETTSDWGCGVEAGKKSLEFMPGGSFDLTYTLPTGSEVGGLPVLAMDGYGTCRRGVELGEAGQGWGLWITTFDADSCAFVEFVLNRVMSTRNAIPRMTDVDRSLARVDPCSLLDPDTLNTLIGPLSDSPSKVDAHSCDLAGKSDMRVILRQYDHKEMPLRTVDLGDGLVVLTDEGEPQSGCTRTYPYREVEGRTEVAEITAKDNHGQIEKTCATAESAIRSLVSRLPAQN